MTYGKLNNGKLDTPTAIKIGRDWVTNPNSEQYISQGYKEVVDILPTFVNYERSYEETATQIIVNYTEVVPPQSIWHEQTNFQIKFTPIDLLDILENHTQMIEYTDTLTQYRDEFNNIYYYVNFFIDMEKELCERYGAIITERI